MHLRTRNVLVVGALLSLPFATLEAAAKPGLKPSATPVARETGTSIVKRPGTGVTPTNTNPTTTSPDGRWEISSTTVRDTTTGRVWERAAGATNYDWAGAKAACDAKTLAGKSDWRLPRVEELDALFVHSGTDLGLPAGHPFTTGNIHYWTSTDTQPNSAMYILVGNGNLFHDAKTTQQGAWCVRGGGDTSYPGTNPRFRVVADTVEDTQTGRVWTRNFASTGDWYTTRLACRARGSAWRLPLASEVAGLMDLAAPESPKLPVGHPFTNTWTPYDAVPLWTLESTDATQVSTVRLADGAVTVVPKSPGSGSGRCIKMDPAATWPAGPVGRFVVNGDTVLDQETRLMWERAPSTTASKWGPANTACQAKSLGGLTGWRLPTIEEIVTLVDFKVAGAPKLPAGHPFVGVQPSTYWTATKIQYLDMKTIKFDTGGTSAMSQPGADLLSWCVRPG